jgi:pectate lyase C
VDCSAIDETWELCDSGPDFCAAVFDDSAGCAAVCAAAGLTCSEVWENTEDGCAPDMSRAALGCDNTSGHESDYCVCTGDGTPGGGGTGGDSGEGGAGGDSGEGGEGGGVVDPPVMDLCDPPSGSTTVNATIVVAAGETYDGECKRFVAGPGVGDGSQSEDQDPVFRVEDGGTLLNVVIGAPAADGIHTYGDVTLQNIVWEDVGEDALTIKASGTVVLDGGEARNGEDKVFQINAASTFRVSNFKATNAGKFLRQNGGTDFKIAVYIDQCDISNMDEAITRTDSASSTVSMTNTLYSQIGGDSTSTTVLFKGFAAGNITQSNNTHY